MLAGFHVGPSIGGDGFCGGRKSLEALRQEPTTNFTHRHWAGIKSQPYWWE